MSLFVCVCQHNWHGSEMFVCLFVFVNITGLAVRCLFCLFVCLFVFVNTAGLVKRWEQAQRESTAVIELKSLETGVN